MNRAGPTLDQLNLVSSNLEASVAFYRRLGVETPEDRVWRTSSGIHHVSAGETESPTIGLEVGPRCRTLTQSSPFCSKLNW